MSARTKLLTSGQIQQITARYNEQARYINSGEKLELEARFLNVTQAQFDALHAQLNFPPFVSSTVELAGGTRKITAGGASAWETKREVADPIFIEERGTKGAKDLVKFSFSVESPSSPVPNFKARLIRTRSRATVQAPSAVIDLTEVISETDRKSESRYEVEVELAGTDLTSYLGVVTEIWSVLVYTTEKVKVIKQDVERVLREPFVRGILVEARNIKARDLVWGGIVGPGGARDENGNVVSSTLKEGCPGVQYSVTLKADGVRRLLLLHATGVWLVYPPHVYQYLGPGLSEVGKRNVGLIRAELVKTQAAITEPIYLFDCEEVTDHQGKKRILLFDTLIWSSRAEGVVDVRSKTALGPKSRLDYTQAGPSFFFLPNHLVQTKPIYKIVTPDDVFTLSRQLLQSRPDYPTDGLMFTPLGVEYNPRSSRYALKTRSLTVLPDVCKWKPPQEITIDFTLRRRDGQVSLWSQGSGRLVPFTGSKYEPLTSSMILDDPSIPNDEIVEFDFINGMMHPKRIRPDKETPNFIDIAEDNWNDIQNPISERWISGLSIDPAISYHKKVKRELLGSLPEGATVLDIGGGKGGDLGLWKKKKLKVYTVEPNRNNSKFLLSRAKTNSFTSFELIETVGQDTVKILAALPRRVDAVTMMLSLSFFFGNDQDLEALTQTVVQSIKYGGRLLFLTINGDAVKAVGQTEFKLADTSFNLVNANTVDIHLPDTIVGEQREHLVDLDQLTQKLQRYGFHLREHYRATAERVMPQEVGVYSGLYSYGYYEHDGKSPLPGELPSREAGVKVAPSSSMHRLEPAVSGVSQLRPVDSPIGTLYLDPEPRDFFSAVMLALPQGSRLTRQQLIQRLREPELAVYQTEPGASAIESGAEISLDYSQYLALAVGHDILGWDLVDSQLTPLGETGLGLGSVVMIGKEGNKYHTVGVLDQDTFHTDISDPATLKVLLSVFQ